MSIMFTMPYNIKTHTTRVPYHPYGGTNMPYVPGDHSSSRCVPSSVARDRLRQRCRGQTSSTPAYAPCNEDDE